MSRHVVLHIGDTHVCSTHPRNDDRLAALDQIIDAARATDRLTAIVWPGDLFHQKSTVEDRNALAPRVQALANLAPVVLTYGNHDAPGDLDIFAKLDAEWPIDVVDRPCMVRVPGATGVALSCFVLPYPHKAGLVSAGAAHDQLGQDARSLLDPVFMAAADELAQASARHDLTLMIGHVNVGGSTASTGQPQIGRELELDEALLARLGPIYKGLNHIHKHQQIAGATYAGSICRLDFGEREAKGFVRVEYDTAVLPDAATWTQTFVPLHVPSQLTVVGRLTREAFTITEIDGEPYIGPPAFTWQGSDLRVSYHYRKTEVSQLDVAKVYAEFAGCRSLKLDPRPEVDHEVRAPEVAAAVTLEAKVAAFCAVNAIPVTDLVLETLNALQGQDHEALLADVRAMALTAGADAPELDSQAVAS
jgi:DNA repair exonuclease SbcCD nuclease subunit